MNLQNALNHVVEEYQSEMEKPFSDNPLADFIRIDIPKLLTSVIDDQDRYLIHGSPGQGNWALVPWIAIFDKFITESAQEGFYLVYLFREDFSGIYLSLNQGVTTIRRLYGSDAKNALMTRASDYLARLGSINDSIITGPIDLHVNRTTNLGAFYEQGAICSIYYPWDNIPIDETLEGDLKLLIKYYYELSMKENSPTTLTAIEDDEQALDVEDLTTLRYHKLIERNHRLSEKVKKVHGYTCTACKFNFEMMYGEIGKYFIEAHHLTPLSKLKGQRIYLNPLTDFAVLCSNCHRMIHKSKYINDINAFRSKYIHFPFAVN